MTQFNDPGSGFWERSEQLRDNSMLVGYGGLGRSDSHDPKIDGKWHAAFSAAVKETSEDVKKDKKRASAIQPITTVMTGPSTRGKVVKRSKRINTGQTLKIPQNPPKPIKTKKGESSDNQTDFGTGQVPKRLRRVKDNFDNI